MTDKDDLEKRPAELEIEIAEAKKHLPAHSVKPPTMQRLLDLEEEYDTILSQLKE